MNGNLMKLFRGVFIQKKVYVPVFSEKIYLDKLIFSMRRDMTHWLNLIEILVGENKK